MDKADKEVLGHAAKVVITKDSTTIVGDGSTQDAVNKRVIQIKNLIEVSLSLSLSLWVGAGARVPNSYYALFSEQVAEQNYEKEKLNERIAKLSGGVAVIQVTIYHVV